jgi:hypothetical protein
MSTDDETTAPGPAQVIRLTADGVTTGSPVIGEPTAADPSPEVMFENHIRRLERNARWALSQGIVPVAYGPWGERIITRDNLEWVWRKPATAAELHKAARKQQQGGGPKW